MIDYRVILDVGVATAQGQRSRNEDSVWAADGLYLVADGMGGHEAGEVASRTAIEVLRGLAVGVPRPTEARRTVATCARVRPGPPVDHGAPAGHDGHGRGAHRARSDRRAGWWSTSGTPGPTGWPAGCSSR